MNQPIDNDTREFYDQFWHRNVPHIEETKRYMLSTISGSGYRSALDAGCGHGLCSIVLSDLSERVVGIDISPVCIRTASEQASKYNLTNVDFRVQDLQSLDVRGDRFDLIWCWGVAMMAPKPLLVIDNLIECLDAGGELYLGLYLKTWLSPIHELTRKFCIGFMNTPARKSFVLNFFAALTRLAVVLKGQEINLRPDNVSVQTQVEDWFYPPHKTFYSISFIEDYLNRKGLKAKCIQNRVGRLKSATIFVIKAEKSRAPATRG